MTQSFDFNKALAELQSGKGLNRPVFARDSIT